MMKVKSWREAEDDQSEKRESLKRLNAQDYQQKMSTVNFEKAECTRLSAEDEHSEL
jgi:hypothetical protein